VRTAPATQSARKIPEIWKRKQREGNVKRADYVMKTRGKEI